MRPSADGPAPWRRIELDIFEARLVQQLANGRPAARQAAIGVVTQEHIGRLASIGDDDRPMSAARLARPIFWLNSRLENVVIVMPPAREQSILSLQCYIATSGAISRNKMDRTTA
jgi:hypothetical protein